MKDKIINWIINVDENKIIMRSTFWNLISSVINAAYSAVLMFFIGRFIGMDEVGIFSLASAYAYQCQAIGAFGVRNVQASDVKKEYSFNDYFSLRILSSIAMGLLMFYYAFFQGYTYEKVAIVFIFCAFKGIEAVEDLYHGEYHRFNRLDIGCILQTTRFLITLSLFIFLLLLTRNLILSFAVSTLVSMIICYIQNTFLIKHFVIDKIKPHRGRAKQLFFICLPVCISNYISAYIVNLPKYAIDKVSNDAMQTSYGILILPVVTINLLSMVIYRPVINTISRHYYHRDFKAFFKAIRKQFMIICALTLIVVFGGYVIGLRLLEIIYGATLSQYMLPFIIMLIGGGINTMAAFFTVILTVQRAQNMLFVVYVITAIIGFLISDPLISTYGMLGTAYVYLIVSACMTVLFLILIISSYHRYKVVN